MKRLLLLLAVLLPARALAAESDATPPKNDGEWVRRDRDRLGWYVPDFARLQTGGFHGLANVSVGYAAFNDVLNWSIGYGFTPAAVADRNVHSFDTTLSVRPIDLRYRDLRFVPGYFGGGLLVGTGDGYFVVTPSRYRDYSRLYYPPTALHWTAHFGVEVDWLPKSGFFERHGGFVEVRTMDTYVFSYLENRKTISLHEIFSTAVGYRVAF